jgi:hypothetical protein
MCKHEGLGLYFVTSTLTLLLYELACVLYDCRALILTQTVTCSSYALSMSKIPLSRGSNSIDECSSFDTGATQRVQDKTCRRH